ncbi:MAG TPA: molybdopterin-binding protein, partial [Candidatus Dormibacteraeota bacterium]
MTRAFVLTVSDRGHAGQMADQSGPAVAGLLTGGGFEVGAVQIVPDEREQIAGALTAAAEAGYDLVVTTGGTGLG